MSNTTPSSTPFPSKAEAEAEAELIKRVTSPLYSMGERDITAAEKQRVNDIVSYCDTRSIKTKPRTKRNQDAKQ